MSRYFVLGLAHQTSHVPMLMVSTPYRGSRKYFLLDIHCYDTNRLVVLILDVAMTTASEKDRFALYLFISSKNRQKN